MQFSNISNGKAMAMSAGQVTTSGLKQPPNADKTVITDTPIVIISHVHFRMRPTRCMALRRNDIFLQVSVIGVCDELLRSTLSLFHPAADVEELSPFVSREGGVPGMFYLVEDSVKIAAVISL